MNIQTFNFGDIAVSFRDDGFLNATAIAAYFGKQPRDYLKTEPTQQYITALAENLSIKSKILIDENQLVSIKNGSSQNGGGTWLHPKLAIHFARWLNPKFAVWCDMQIEQILSGSQAIQQPLPLTDTTKKALPNGLTIEQQDEIKKLHRELVEAAPKEQQAKLAVTLWSSIKSKFGVPYKKVPSEQYAEVLSLMARVAVDNSLRGEVLDKAPTLNAPTSQEYFAHLAKMACYANEYQKIQAMICDKSRADEAKKFMTTVHCGSNENGAAYLFVFKPNIQNDVQKAYDFLHRFSQAI